MTSALKSTMNTARPSRNPTRPSPESPTTSEGNYASYLHLARNSLTTPVTITCLSVIRARQLGLEFQALKSRFINFPSLATSPLTTLIVTQTLNTVRLTHS